MIHSNLIHFCSDVHVFLALTAHSPLVQLALFLFQALSGVGQTIQDRAHISQNTALSAALNTQFLIQIGIFTAIPMILGFILEQGFFRVCIQIFALTSCPCM